MTNREIAIGVFLTALLLLLMGAITAKAQAAPPVPDQATYKLSVPDQVKMPAAVPQKTFVPDQVTMPGPVGDLFGRQPCQPVRNVIRRLIREKIKDRLIPTPPSFPIGWPNGVMSSRACVDPRCW